jgi:arylsulfatase A-like enzyme
LRFVIALAAAVVFAMAAETTRAADAPPASAAPRPNILFIIADDMGYNDVGFNGGKEIKTPNIDSIAAAGARLEQFYVQPVCSPTRAALMTGRYPMRYGLQTGVVRPWADYGLPLDEPMLPAELKKAGYVTAISGKWHLGHIKPEYLPTRRGFDYQYGHYNGALDYFTHDREGGHDWHRNDKRCDDKGYSTHLIADEAAKLIRAHGAPKGGDKPLFMYVPFNAVHSPLQVPDKYMQPYANLNERRRIYAGMLAAMDEGVGKILAALDEKKIRDNTLIVFCSDNGGFNPDRVTDNKPLRNGKGSLYEGGVRVAACAAWSGQIPAGSSVKQPIHIVDMFPTLLKLAGATVPDVKPIDGKDAWATMAKGAPTPHDQILHNATPRNGAIRVGDFKLILNGEKADGDLADRDLGEGEAGEPADGVAGKPQVELFNIAEDPTEKNNLAAKQPEKVKELRKRYDALAAQAVAPLSKPKAANYKPPAVWGEVD